MRKLATYGSAVLFALLVVGPFAGPAAAGGPEVTVSVNRDVIRAGQTFRVTARADLNCQWLVRWNGERRVGAGKRFDGRFTAPVVTRKTRLPVRATCFYATPRGPSGRAPGGASQRITVTVPRRVTGTEVVTVLPDQVTPPKPPHGGLGGLPNTGGPNGWLALAGVLSLAGGAALVRRTLSR